MPNFKNDAPGNGTKLIVPEQQKYRVRKLTPKECWRLMGFEDSDFENARKRMNENLYKGNDRSSSQLYKQAGNSIVVDVLLHIMENLYDAIHIFSMISLSGLSSPVSVHLKKRWRNFIQSRISVWLSAKKKRRVYSRSDISTTTMGTQIECTVAMECPVPSRQMQGGAEQKRDGTRFPTRPNRSTGQIYKEVCNKAYVSNTAGANPR